LNEDQLITAIRGIVEETSSRNVPAPRPIVLGIGDDAAAWQPSRSHLSVITSDALVDGVHFLGERMSGRSIGYRAMAANLSDIAAMGARPVLATVALGVPPRAQETQLLDLYTGMLEIARRHGVRIAGGDIVRAGALMLAITVVGEVRRTHLRRRDAGRPGDIIAVTGPLGGSHAGLQLLRHHDLSVPTWSRERGLRAFERPEPRVSEGRRLAASSHVHAMMDCSDGLWTDLSRMARASGCGALIEHVPIDPAAQAVAAALGEDASVYAHNGGEDFELIVTIAARAFTHLARRFETHFGRPLIRVGVLEKKEGLRMREASGEIQEVTPAGWDHLTLPEN
jgi:thiamine-monophosphate kinase